MNVALGLKGIVTVEVVSPKGDVVHQEVQENIITDEGIAALNEGSIKITDLLGTCILGRNSAPPAAGNTYWGSWEKGYFPDCPNECKPAMAPMPGRKISAVSTTAGSRPDVLSFVDDPVTYWSLKRTRHFFRDESFFLASDPLPISFTAPYGVICSDTWPIDGWGNLSSDASYIKDVAFCYPTPELKIEYYSCTRIDPILGEVPYWLKVLHWLTPEYTSPILWNRIVLAQSIGYQGTPWPTTPDVVIPPDYIIRVSMELRVYVDPEQAVGVVDINGVSTTVRTQFNDLDNPDFWGPGFDQGFFYNFGLWREDLTAARVGESNVMPDLYERPLHVLDWSDCDRVEVVSAEGGSRRMLFEWNASSALFDTGVGFFQHCNVGSLSTRRHLFNTTFTPKIQKTNVQKLQLEVTYSWSRR